MARLSSLSQTNRPYKLEITNYDDPECCTAINRDTNRRCTYKCEEGSAFCPKHNRGQKAKNLRNYRLSQLTCQRVGEFATNPEIKSLREEIGITRMVLEKILNMCEDEQDIVLNSAQIANMVDKVDKLVNSCNKLEIQNDQLLDRGKIIALADGILRILTDELNDEKKIGVIASRMGELLTQG